MLVSGIAQSGQNLALSRLAMCTKYWLTATKSGRRFHSYHDKPFVKHLVFRHQSKEVGKDQESILLSTTPDTVHHMESDKNTRNYHTQESQKEEVSLFFFPAGDHKAARNRQDGKTTTNMKHK